MILPKARLAKRPLNNFSVPTETIITNESIPLKSVRLQVIDEERERITNNYYYKTIEVCRGLSLLYHTYSVWHRSKCYNNKPARFNCYVSEKPQTLQNIARTTHQRIVYSKIL